MATLHFRRIERRRTARVGLCVDLIVEWQTESNRKFKIETRTFAVSGHGGIMVLEQEVRTGQQILVVNANSGVKAECKVVATKVLRDGTRSVAFEFVSAGINFWKMCFPVPGAKPLRRTVQVMLNSVPATR